MNQGSYGEKYKILDWGRVEGDVFISGRSRYPIEKSRVVRLQNVETGDETIVETKEVNLKAVKTYVYLKTLQ